MSVAKADQEKTYEVTADQYYKSVTQYEQYPEHVEGMKSVRIDRTGSSVIGHYELSMMGKEISYSLNLKEDPANKKMNWTLKDSDFFTVNNGAWTIESTGPKSCKVHYAVEVEFNFPVPGFLLKGIVKSTLPTMMNSFYERAKKL
jgi:ribosome-associated toxin RatA of RatAB toxin-antitoxin module